MQADSGFQVGQLFAESIGQASESPAHHANGEVLPFDVGRGNVAGIGPPIDQSSGPRHSARTASKTRRIG